jgi:hypothetical protein
MADLNVLYIEFEPAVACIKYGDMVPLERARSISRYRQFGSECDL